MQKPPIRVTVTGAAGQIGYALVFRIASGQMFGPDQPVALQMIEIPVEKPMQALQGVAMELADCAFPLLVDTVVTSDLEEGFRGANQCLLVGSKPRGPGMERGDLIRENGPIFTGQGRAIMLALASCSDEPPLPIQSATIYSKPYTVDRIYRSMTGPDSVQPFAFDRRAAPELIWITGFEAQIVSGEEQQPVSPEFMCHSNMDFVDSREHSKLVRNEFVKTNPRLFTLSQDR